MWNIVVIGLFVWIRVGVDVLVHGAGIRILVILNQVLDKTAAKKVATSGWPQPSSRSISWVDKPFGPLGHIGIKASDNAADCKIKEKDERQNDNHRN